MLLLFTIFLLYCNNVIAKSYQPYLLQVPGGKRRASVLQSLETAVALETLESLESYGVHDAVRARDSIELADFETESLTSDAQEPITINGFTFNSPYPLSSYIKYVGADFTALFATSISITNEYAVVSANGFNIFDGHVRIFRPVSIKEWTEISSIQSPAGPEANFGISVSLDESNERLIVGANGYNVYTGIAYIYDNSNGIFTLNATLESPFGRGLQARSQGFGYTTSISGYSAIVGTSSANYGKFVVKLLLYYCFILLVDIHKPLLNMNRSF